MCYEQLVIAILFIKVMWGAPVLNCVHLLVKAIQKPQVCSLGLGMVASGVGPLVRTIHHFSFYITSVDLTLMINKLCCSV